jgi:hypothetical protein
LLSRASKRKHFLRITGRSYLRGTHHGNGRE